MTEKNTKTKEFTSKNSLIQTCVNIVKAPNRSIRPIYSDPNDPDREWPHFVVGQFDEKTKKLDLNKCFRLDTLHGENFILRVNGTNFGVNDFTDVDGKTDLLGLYNFIKQTRDDTLKKEQQAAIDHLLGFASGNQGNTL